MRKVLKVGIIAVPLMLGVALIALSACDQDYPGGFWDAAVDTNPEIIVEAVEEPPPDLPVDVPVETPVDVPVETPVDVPVETTPDPVADDTGSSCTYPTGTYAFDRVGDLVGPVTWPACIKAAGETYPLAHADLREFYCDPEVQSILVFHATMS